MENIYKKIKGQNKRMKQITWFKKHKKVLNYLLLIFGILLIVLSFLIGPDFITNIGNSFADDGNCEPCKELRNINQVLLFMGVLILTITIAYNTIKESQYKKVIKIMKVTYPLLLLIGSSIFFMNMYFPSQDGPEHIFTNQIIQEVKQGDEFYSSQIFVTNKLIPNSIFNHIVKVASKFVNPIAAQKLILALTFLSLNLSFFLLISFFSENKLRTLSLTHLFVPLSFANLIRIGLFNFYFGLVFLVLNFYLFNKILVSKSKKLFAILFVTTVILFYSHFFAWLLYGSLILLFLLYDLVERRFIQKKKIELNSLKLFLASAFIPLILSIKFLLGISSGNTTKIAQESILSILYTNFIAKLPLNLVQAFTQITYGGISSLISLAITFALIVFIILNIKKLKLKKYLILAGIFLLSFIFIPDYISGFSLFSQFKLRFWIPAIILLLIVLSQIKNSKKKDLILGVSAIATAFMLIFVIASEVNEKANSVKESLDELNQIDLKENSTVLNMVSVHDEKNHIIAYYCLDHRCLHHNSWFRFPDTFNGGYKYPMPTPPQTRGYLINESHLVYDYYVFNGPNYAEIQNITDKLNLTPVYLSKEWKIFE